MVPHLINVKKKAKIRNRYNQEPIFFNLYTKFGINIGFCIFF